MPPRLRHFRSASSRARSGAGMYNRLAPMRPAAPSCGSAMVGDSTPRHWRAYQYLRQSRFRSGTVTGGEGFARTDDVDRGGSIRSITRRLLLDSSPSLKNSTGLRPAATNLSEVPWRPGGRSFFPLCVRQLLQVTAVVPHHEAARETNQVKKSSLPPSHRNSSPLNHFPSRDYLCGSNPRQTFGLPIRVSSRSPSSERAG
jgi:hypothetical protein